ncbi:MAG: hypothetical protein U0264_01915 [Candidatus Kapaibacterium sp.]
MYNKIRNFTVSKIATFLFSTKLSIYLQYETSIFIHYQVFYMENKQNTGQRLEIWILKNFKNKSDFCQKAGVSLQTLKNYTNGRSGIGGKFSTILRGLGCDVEWLVSGVETKSPVIQPAIQLEKVEVSNENLILLEIMHRVLSLEDQGKKLQVELKEVKEELKEAKYELKETKHELKETKFELKEVKLEKAGHAVAQQ